ncbi:MAG: RIP metalloprotease RseP [Deltaproteobacteria bacterium]|nr:RIP metalloprotease RseP [Deltaproteobacteria bacterium]
MGTNIFAFIIVLGVLIFFHEFGHFLIARLFGVGVEKFSLGFGPRLIGKKIGITDYRLSAIPLGGYVKMVGEEPDAEITPEYLPLSFTHKHVAKRMLIVAAGPVFNILLAIIIFFGIFFVSGTFIMKPSIGSVREGSPAATAGLEKGDLITRINGAEISSWDEMAEIINASEGGPLSISVQRPHWH